MRSACTDGKTIQAVVGFSPPAIQNRQVKTTVQHYLLTARSRGFERTPGIVQPDIDSLHQVAADIDIVILDEDELVSELTVFHEFRNLLQYTFSRIVVRVSFSGEDELHRTLGVINHACQFFDIRQDQVRSFICRETPRKTDRERIGSEHASCGCRRVSAMFALVYGAQSNEFEQLRFQAKMRFPQFTVVDLLDSLPDSRIAAVFVPAGPEMPVVKPEHLRSEPRRHMYTIGDVPDRN